MHLAIVFALFFVAMDVSMLRFPLDVVTHFFRSEFLVKSVEDGFGEFLRISFLGNIGDFFTVKGDCEPAK